MTTLAEVFSFTNRETWTYHHIRHDPDLVAGLTTIGIVMLFVGLPLFISILEKNSKRK